MRPLSLATDKELSDFLKSVEKRAFKRTVYAVRDDDAALDIVQDAMIRLSEKYADRPAPSCRCCSSASCRTRRWTGSAARRCATRSCAISRSSSGAASDGDFDILETLRGLGGPLAAESAADSVSRAQILQAIDDEVARTAGTSTRGLSAALLGGTRRRRDRRRDGLLRRQRQDALLAGGACAWRRP